MVPRTTTKVVYVYVRRVTRVKTRLLEAVEQPRRGDFFFFYYKSPVEKIVLLKRTKIYMRPASRLPPQTLITGSESGPDRDTGIASFGVLQALLRHKRARAPNHVTRNTRPHVYFIWRGVSFYLAP